MSEELITKMRHAYDKHRQHGSNFAQSRGMRAALAVVSEEIETLRAANERLREDAERQDKGIAASLAAAISLLERSPKTGAPSDKMFDMMVADYKKALEKWRTGMGENCAWYDDGGTWASECGVYYGFHEGGPVENEHTYCIKCGKKVSVLDEAIDAARQEEG